MDNIQEEFKVFKESLKELNIDVVRIEKVGNGSMDFHEVFYKSTKYEEIKSVYVNRQNIDDLIERFKEAYK